MNIKVALHIARNPHSWTDEDVRQARLIVCDALEVAQKDTARLDWFANNCRREASIRIGLEFKACRTWTVAADGHDLRATLDTLMGNGK